MTEKSLSEKICEVCGIEPIEEKYCYFECRNPEYKDKPCNKIECEHNPDKEQIMIDGVDVSKCYRYQKKTGCCEGAFKPEELPFCENFDCEFKQLARKEQECEELLKENQQLRNSLSDSLMFKFTGQENETNRYRKALEEIEEYCNNVLSFTAVRTTESDILNIINKAKGEGKCNTKI